jgi:hypothetical protein
VICGFQHASPDCRANNTQLAGGMIQLAEFSDPWKSQYFVFTGSESQMPQPMIEISLHSDGTEEQGTGINANAHISQRD